ncbi:hypothetical protein [Brevundimonas kwangchunensis]
MNGSNSETRPIQKRAIDARATFRPGTTTRPFGWWAARQGACATPAQA